MLTADFLLKSMKFTSQVGERREGSLMDNSFSLVGPKSVKRYLIQKPKLKKYVFKDTIIQDKITGEFKFE